MPVKAVLDTDILISGLVAEQGYPLKLENPAFTAEGAKDAKGS